MPGSLLLFAAESPSVYYAFTNSDLVGQAIVVFLLVSSVFTWTVMLDKGFALRLARRESERFLYLFRNNKKSLTALARESESNPSPVSAVYAEGLEQLMTFYEDGAPGSAAYTHSRSISTAGGRPVAPVRLTSAQLNAIEAVLEREVSIQIMDMETRVGFLATMVSVSPFFGLFGTVWGVMLAFCGIAMAGKSDFAALAPGVAGALLTTVAGLIVAIPSLIGYNLITASIRKMTIAMDNFTEEFMVQVKLEQIASDPSLEEGEKNASPVSVQVTVPVTTPQSIYQPQPQVQPMPQTPPPQPVYQQPAPAPAPRPVYQQPAPVPTPAPAPQPVYQPPQPPPAAPVAPAPVAPVAPAPVAPVAPAPIEPAEPPQSAYTVPEDIYKPESER